MNGSADFSGVFNVYTGAKTPSSRGQVNTWEYGHSTGFFKSNCDAVHGSAGELHPSNLTPESVVYLFAFEMCRAFPLEYVETVQVEGITGYKYAAGPRYVDNGKCSDRVRNVPDN